MPIVGGSHHGIRVAAAATMHQQGVTPLTYYDDWGWYTTDFYQNQPTLQSMIHFCTLAKLSFSVLKNPGRGLPMDRNAPNGNQSLIKSFRKELACQF